MKEMLTHESYPRHCHCLTATQNKWGAQSFTIFLQVFSEDTAGLSPLGGVVQGNVSVDVLQQNVHPGLPDAGQENAEKTQTKHILAGAIHQTWIDDKVGPIILASQRCVPEQNHGDINRQYGEWIKELIK